MELQVVLPNESPGMSPDALVELGVAAERLGYHTAWLPDHLLPPADYGETYGGVYEPLTTLTYLGARTSVIGLGTSVLVLPMRNAFVVAKQAATLDRLTGERLSRQIPIIVGGVSDRALARASALADEWQGFGLSTTLFASRVARLRNLSARPIRVSTRIGWPGDTSDPTAAVAQARELAEAGADAVAVWFGDHAGFGERMARFAWGIAADRPT